MNAENLLLGGVWLGPVKPQMEIVLEPIITEINKIDLPLQGRRNLKAKVLLGVFDLPAKAAALNCIQFNGEYGCSYCLDEGTYTLHRRLYLPTDSHDPRCIDDMMEWANEAERTRKPVFGVKGQSVLSPHLNILKSIPIDYMHAVLEGVTKSLLTFWFDSKNHTKNFYLGGKSQDINRALLRIKPPHDFRRTPRSIQTAKYWKASEYRAWLLFYSVPVLSSFLPKDYLFHLSLLVASMHMLLGTSISSSDLESAHSMLVRFYELVPQLYPETLCTMNVHSLIHLCEFVHRWGPLWCYSAFGFENFNGYLKKHCHGTRNVLPQLINAVQLCQKLPILQKRFLNKENEATKAFLEKITKSSKQAKTGPLGRIVHKHLSEEEKTAIENAGYHVTRNVLPVFPRYRKNGVVFTSKSTKLRNSTVCMISIATGDTSEICFSSISLFCFVNGSPIIIAKVFELCGNILPQSSLQSSLRPEDIEATKNMNAFIYKVKKLSLSGKLIVISPEALLEKCVHIPMKYSPNDVIVTLPNTFEYH